MSDKSAIEWTDATWNPIDGLLEGVARAARTATPRRSASRFGKSSKPWTPANADENVIVHPERFELPLRWREPRRVFVNSMSDLFHELVRGLGRSPRLGDDGASATPRVPGADQASRAHARGRAPASRRTGHPPERLAGYVDREQSLPIAPTTSARRRRRCASSAPSRCSGRCPPSTSTGIDWLIVGGESGPGHRPMEVEWVRDLRDRSIGSGRGVLLQAVGRSNPEGGRPRARRADLE